MGVITSFMAIGTDFSAAAAQTAPPTPNTERNEHDFKNPTECALKEDRNHPMPP